MTVTKRQVQQGLLSYRDTAHVWRHALSGENVDVDPEDLERFDKLNDPEGEHAPKRPKGPATTEPKPDSRRTVKKQAAKAAGA